MSNLINVKKEAPIGFFDSGIGGLSVLREAIKLLPRENFIYFGDSKNAPYGTKTVDEIKRLSYAAADFLLGKGVKAIVIACNTATSAAASDLRSTYPEIPIIGIEPAIKPAVQLNRRGKILIMATPLTISEKKFNNLMKSFENTSEIIPIPCAGLAELIESGNIESLEIRRFLEIKLKPYLSFDISTIVLGCTHYPFIKDHLSAIVGEDIPIIDGSFGTAKQLRRLLIQKDLINESIEAGKIEIFNSLADSKIIDLSYRLLKQ
ncbi:MAG: glutamate racemase [Clostridiales bacterium]|uniref:glutamate racemase n=1 Tax=Clostridium sp. N3C TaxID=1776758 RepID=UPI00092E0FDB|nr:glutamate racemase [Clostridium sp. N3C]NLZ47415.1 glutamate racemase [Clostridiales bacterium]SCN24220.1 Glutamate racemase 2 [Clostridium sp. N3C]